MPPWIADFRFSAALVSFFSWRVPGLWGVVFLLVDDFRVFGSGFFARYVSGLFVSSWA